VALGAAMVVAFTGVAFAPDSLTGGRTFLLDPPQSDLETDSAEYSALTYSDDRLHTHITTLPSQVQRALAELVPSAAAGEAGIEGEPPVAATIGQFGGAKVGVPLRAWKR
jgi:hypothetical protein